MSQFITGNSGVGDNNKKIFNKDLDEYDDVSIANSDMFYQKLISSGGLPKMNDDVFNKAMNYLHTKEGRRERLKSMQPHNSQ